MSERTPLARHKRTLRILICLQSGAGFNARELAQRLQVSRRTIYRDLNLLRDAGVRVEFDDDRSAYRVAGPRGGNVVPIVFDVEDLTKLALSAHLSLLHGFTDFGFSVRETLAKLLASYPAGVQEAVTRVISCCQVELPRPNYRAEELERVEQVLEAMRRRVQLRMMLRDEEETPRWTRFCPYRLVVSPKRWLVEGRSSQHRRTLRVPTDHIVAAELTQDPYQIPRGFRIRGQVSDSGSPGDASTA